MKLGIIGGTALEVLPLENCGSLAVDTQWGTPGGTLFSGRLEGSEVVFLNRHGDDHSVPPHAINYRANIAALHSLSVDAILAVNAVGGITQAMTAGTLAIPDQIIDYTWGRGHTYSDGAATDLVHIDFTRPYCDRLRSRLLASAAGIGLKVVDGGVYGVTQGPRLETAAEIVRLERDGCDLVGMTGMPEAALARELGVPYAAVAVVVNAAAGKGPGEITLAEISAVMTSVMPAVGRLLKAFCRA